MADYHRGDMDIHEQVNTFSGFNKAAKWGSLALAVLLTMLVFWFCTPVGFLTGAIAGAVVLAGGVLMLRDKPGAH
jgi:hypothetical protein